MQQSISSALKAPQHSSTTAIPKVISWTACALQPASLMIEELN